MAFRFRLQALLRLRQVREQRERLQLELILRELLQARTQIEAFEQERRVAWGEFEERLRAGMIGAELHLEALLAAARAARQRALSEQLRRLEEHRLQQMATFQKAQQHRKVVETLWVRQFEAYRGLQARRTQQTLDDLFLMGWLRSTR